MDTDPNVSRLIVLLQAALNHPMERSRLLQQPELLREIMNNIPARRWLFEQACHANRPNPATDIIVAIMQDSKLIWRGGSLISPDIYSEALSRAWVWFVESLKTYEPETASFVTWFNQKLRWMIQEVIRGIANDEKRQLHPATGEENDEWIYPPAPNADRWHETIQEWLELVRNHPHLLGKSRMQNSPHVNCQVVLIQILTILENSGAFSWDAIAKDYEVESSALRRFCKKRCFSCFQRLLSE